MNLQIKIMINKLQPEYLTEREIISIFEKQFGYTYHLKNCSCKEIDNKLILAAIEIQEKFYKMNN